MTIAASADRHASRVRPVLAVHLPAGTSNDATIDAPNMHSSNLAHTQLRALSTAGTSPYTGVGQRNETIVKGSEIQIATVYLLHELDEGANLIKRRQLTADKGETLLLLLSSLKGCQAAMLDQQSETPFVKPVVRHD